MFLYGCSNCLYDDFLNGLRRISFVVEAEAAWVRWVMNRGMFCGV